MKDFILGLALILWLLITFVLMISVIGWILLIKENRTGYHQTGDDARTVWVQFGYDIKDYFISMQD